MIKRFVAIVGLLSLALAGALVVIHKPFDTERSYVTSEACQGCHADHYNAWHDTTLHPKMFHPVGGPNKIQGDFTSDNPALTFAKSDVEFVIGNKWEQVYARMIDGEYYPLPAKWLITTQQWIPYKVDTWRETPLSTKCNGCHTTGFNPDTFEFAEFGIGCESCHGAGSRHVHNRRAHTDEACLLCHDEQGDGDDGEWEKDIANSISSAVCGQCHTRGTQTQDAEHIQTTFNFPLNVEPGQDIGGAFTPMTQAKDKKGKHWWALGLSKNRHQEFADFSVSKHAEALVRLKERHTPDRGKLVDTCLSCHSADYINAADDDKPTLDTAKHGLTCVTCHEPHGLDRRFAAPKKPAERCGSCHVDSMDRMDTRAGREKHYPGPVGAKSCPDCHMPYIVKSGGAFPIRSHAFKVVPPIASKQFDMPNSCQNGGCHEDKSVDWAIQEFEAFYRKPQVDASAAEAITAPKR